MKNLVGLVFLFWVSLALGSIEIEGTLPSADGVSIHYKSAGSGDSALVFVHGWIGNIDWWESQTKFFSNRYQVVRIDLAGHGASGSNRKQWTAQAYAEDIRAVVDRLCLKRVILIGHSMSGTNIVAAYDLLRDRVVALVPVDTLLDLDRAPSKLESETFFGGLKLDFKMAVEFGMRQFMFARSSPPKVVERIVKEARNARPEIAIPALETVYATDVRSLSRQVRVPVRSINADLYPTNPIANRKYFTDFDYKVIEGVGHYPMLEAPDRFNAALEEILNSTKEVL